MLVDLKTTCQLLKAQDNIVILTHRKPDGDTLGAGFALMYALKAMGKTVRLECPDALSGRYSFLYGGEYLPESFQEQFVVAVDVADMQLLAQLKETYANRIDLCIDHHKSNEFYARQTLLDPEAAATTQIIHQVVEGMGVVIDKEIANAIFTGLTTDTGGFRFANVTAQTHRCAAEMIDRGAEHALINQLVFETKSKGRLEAEKLVLQGLEYYYDGRCALIYLPADVSERYNVTEEELDGISSLPRTIEGVMVGVTVRDRGDGSYRVSLRTRNPVDASVVCAIFGGGGHANAAGCTLTGGLDENKIRLLDEIGRELERKKS